MKGNFCLPCLAIILLSAAVGSQDFDYDFGFDNDNDQRSEPGLGFDIHHHRFPPQLPQPQQQRPPQQRPASKEQMCAFLEGRIGWFSCRDASYDHVARINNRLQFSVTNCGSSCINERGMRGGGCRPGPPGNDRWCPIGQSCACF